MNEDGKKVSGFNRNHANIFVSVLLASGFSLSAIIFTGKVISLIRNLF